MTRLSRIWLGAEGVIFIRSAVAPMTGDVQGRVPCGVSDVSTSSGSA
jgi:hypothetical protein